MAHFLLIHGACHGAWCWRDAIPAIEALGHTASAIDLPSHGDDPTPTADVTLDLYGQRIAEELRKRDGKAILLGHSMGGFPISVAAQLAPEKIERLIYLAAHVPRPGMSMAKIRYLIEEQPLASAVDILPDGINMVFKPDLAKEILYQDCPEGTLEYALENLCPQPIAPQTVEAAVGAAYASVPRSYIICENDQTIPPALQEILAEEIGEENTYRIASGHSPFFACPDKFAQILNDIAKV